MTHFKGPDGQEDMPYLMTAGGVTTSRDVKFAMLADWGAKDTEFIHLMQNVAATLKTFAGADAAYECVLLEGSAVGGIEAALGTFAPSKRKKTLIVCNGVAGHRAVQIMERMGRNHGVLNCSELSALMPDDIAKAIDDDRNITHVWVVHCETATGVVNPLAEIASVTKSRGRILMVDAVSSFGALPIDMMADGIDVLVSCPENCLESVPGFSFVLAKRDLLLAAKGESPSMALDLFEQWQSLQAAGEFRGTPPTHALVALHQALRELSAEGGIEVRGQRYRATAEAFTTRIKALGFSLLLPPTETGPIIQTVLSPADPKFNFTTFYAKLRSKGFAVSAGELKSIESFRVGMMGQVNEKLIIQLISAIESVMAEMDVGNFAPAKER